MQTALSGAAAARGNGSTTIAIDPTQIPGQLIDRLREPLTVQARGVDAGEPGHAAAEFGKQMGVAVDTAGPAHALGDRVLVNTPISARKATALRRATPAEAVAAKSSIDTSRLVDLLHTQAEIAQFRARVGLAAAGVQRSTQGLDTLLKSQ
ncbi:MAG: hypothetical protein OXP09_10370 [Gammaproteobacteria bacterium]|nr:hypothetical protein [Gammaproteobacteria bacterium]